MNKRRASYLIAIHHEMMCGDKGLEHHNPALTGCPLNQCVSQMRYTHTQLIGAMHQIWALHRNKDTNETHHVTITQEYFWKSIHISQCFAENASASFFPKVPKAYLFPKLVNGELN